MSSFAVYFESRKKIVKVASPSTLLQAILEEAAQHFSVDPSQCSLKHKGKVIDLSVPTRLSGLPNLASLDLEVRPSTVGSISSAASSSTSTISINVNGGEQSLMDSFASDASLQDLLQHFIAKDLLPSNLLSDLNPEVIYFRSKFAGADLARTSLSTLGLAGKTGKLQLRFLRAAEANAAMEIAETDPAPTAATIAAALTPREQIAFLLQSNFDSVSRQAVVTLFKYLANIAADPSNIVYRSISCTNKVYTEKIAPAKGAFELLLCVEFVLDTADKRLHLAATADMNRLREAITVLTQAMDELDIPQENRPVIKASSQPPPGTVVADPFDPFRTSVFRTTPQPTRTAVEVKSSTETQVEALRRRRREIEGDPREFKDHATEVIFPGDSPMRSNETMSSEAEDGEGPGLLPKGLIAKAMKIGVEDETPLTTRAIRELQKLEKEKVYQFSVIRIRFPDKVQLVGRFHVRHKTMDIYTWVASCLRPEVVGGYLPKQGGDDNECEMETKKASLALFTHGFELYTSPPRIVLMPIKPSATVQARKSKAEVDFDNMESEEVADAGLVPAAVINLAWRQPLPTPSSFSYSSSSASASASAMEGGGEGGGLEFTGPGWYLRDEFLSAASAKAGFGGGSAPTLVMPQGVALIPVAEKSGGRDGSDAMADGKDGSSSTRLAASGDAAKKKNSNKKFAWFKL